MLFIIIIIIIIIENHGGGHIGIQNGCNFKFNFYISWLLGR